MHDAGGFGEKSRSTATGRDSESVVTTYHDKRIGQRPAKCLAPRGTRRAERRNRRGGLIYQLWRGREFVFRWRDDRLAYLVPRAILFYRGCTRQHAPQLISHISPPFCRLVFFLSLCCPRARFRSKPVERRQSCESVRDGKTAKTSSAVLLISRAVRCMFLKLE